MDDKKIKNVRPKKHLGQHFLKDENIARKIVDALSPNNEKVIEIGPGTGVLTKYLIDKNNFEAFDVDSESVEFLKKSYPENEHKIKFQDYLKSDSFDEKVSIIGNFPYNISSQIFFKIWDDRDSVGEVVCMIQKEVADRIASPSGNKTYGILSVLLQAFYEIEILFKVPPGVFNPPPKVTSAVLKLERNQIEKLPCDESLFKSVVKEGFGKRRKTLRNALKGLILPESEVDDVLLNARAEQLTVNDFISLTQKISKYKKNAI